MRTIRLMLLIILLLNTGIGSMTLAKSPNQFTAQGNTGFIPNQGQVATKNGQVAKAVKYYAKGEEYSIYFREKGISYVFTNAPKTNRKAAKTADPVMDKLLPNLQKVEKTLKAKKGKGFRVDMDFKGASSTTKLKGRKQTKAHFNYYYPHCPNGVTDVQGYQELVYKDVYEGIDIRFYFKQGKLKYDIRVSPGANPDRLQFQYKPVHAVKILTAGNAMRVAIPDDTLREIIPKAYQPQKKDTKTVACQYHKADDNTLKLSVGEAYNPEKALVIDPLIRDWATFFGATGSNSVATDSLGNAYITGFHRKYAKKLPVTAGAFQKKASGGAGDGFIAKFDTSGGLVWSTYYGGSNFERFQDLDVFKNQVVIGGSTNSKNFPVSSNAFQMKLKGQSRPNSSRTGNYEDGFLISLTEQGKRKWATYLGGKFEQNIEDVSVNQLGIFVSGFIADYTQYSTNPNYYKTFPTTSNALHQAATKRWDNFLCEFSKKGNLSYSTFLNSKSIYLSNLATNRKSIVVGGSVNNQMPVKNTFNTTANSNKVSAFYFIEFDYNYAIKWGSYVYGNSVNDIALSNDGQLYAAVEAYADSFFQKRSFAQRKSIGYSTGLLKFDKNRNISWSSFLPDYNIFMDNEIQSIDISKKGNLFFSGNQSCNYYCQNNTSPLLPTTPNAFQGDSKNDRSYNTNLDAFFGMVDPDGYPQYLSYYSGGNDEQETSIAAKDTNNVYITGNTFSQDFPVTPNSYQPTKQLNGRESFLLNFDVCIRYNDLSLAYDTSENENRCYGDSIAIYGDTGFVANEWYKPRTNQKIDTTPNTKVIGFGDYVFKGYRADGCVVYDTLTIPVPDSLNFKAPRIKRVSVDTSGVLSVNWQQVKANVGSYIVWLRRQNTTWRKYDTVDRDSSLTIHNINTYDRYHRIRVQTSDSCTKQTSPFSKVHRSIRLDGGDGQLEASLSWTAYKGYQPKYYKIYRKARDTFEFIDTIGGQQQTYIDDSLDCGVKQTYKVAAFDSNKSYPAFSDTAQVTPFDTIPPQPPRLYNVHLTNNKNAKLGWQKPKAYGNNVEAYVIFRDSLGLDTNYQKVGMVTDTTLFVDSQVNINQYRPHYYIKAIDSCRGNPSQPSDTQQVLKPVAQTGACQPENWLVSDFHWELPKKVDQFEVLRFTTNDGNSPKVIYSQTPPLQRFNDTAVIDTIQYCYRMRAVDQQSDFAVATDTVCQEPFDYPVPDTSEVIRTTVTKTGKTNGAVKVFWQRYPKNDTFARGYEIYHTTGQKPNNFLLIHRNKNLSDTTFTHKGINTSENVHNYRVLVYNLCKDQGGFFNTHQPVNLSATNQNLSIKLDWVPYRGFPVQDYRVQKSIDGGPFRNIATLNGSDTSLVDSNIRCGIDYSYKVFADGTKAQQTSVSDTIIRTGYDTIPADRPDLHRATVIQTDNNQGKVELLFKGAPQANRKGYVISQEQGNSFQPLDTIFTTQQTNLTYTANKLSTASTSQTFYVQTIDSCGNTSLPSDTHRTIALTAKPKNAYVQLKWSAYRDWNDRTYQVQRRQSSAPWQTLTTLDSGQLSYRDSNVTCQEVYQYRIIGKEKGTSDQARSNTDTAKAFESTPPAPPVIRRASVTRTGTSGGKVNITWIPSTSRDAAKYTIYRSLDGQDYQFLDSVAGTSYTDQGLNTYNQPYHYRLKAIDSCDNLSDSFSTPHKTINLEANGTEEAVILSWTAYKGRTVSQYHVLRGSEVLYTVSGEQTFLRDEKVICDTFYNYQVRALMEGDTSIQALSNTDSAKATDNTPPRPIYLNRASVTRFNEVVELKWQASEAYDAQAYQIYRRNENTGDFNQIAEVKHPNTTYQDSFPINNREVCYFVKVKDACNNTSEFSNRGCIIQPDGEALDLENELSWPPYQKWQKGTRTYEVFKQTGDSTYQSLARLDSSQRSYLDQELRDSADQFCYYIQAKGFGEGTFSRSTKICLEQSAIVHIPNTFSPGVTPNLNDQFGPEGLYIANYEMQVYNRWGEQVFSTSTSEKWDGTYQGELVPQGVYHYQIVMRSEDGSRQTYSGVLTVIR